MLLRAQAIGQEPCIRFVIRRLEDNTFWNGTEFNEDLENSQKYYTPSDACFVMQDILKEHYGHLPMRRFVVPIEVEVYGNVSKKEVAEYLYRASILSIRCEEHGNGPNESYVAPVIHWGYLREFPGSVKKHIDGLATEWQIELTEDFDMEDDES